MKSLERLSFVIVIGRQSFVGKCIGSVYAMAQEARVSDEKSGREREKPTATLHQWDATSLITCAKFQLEGRVILDYMLDVAHIVITREVQQETVEAGFAGGYPDAMAIKERIDAGRIGVRTVAGTPASFEEVLDLYGLQEGDKAVVRLALQAADVTATVTDDRLLYIVLHRCGHQALFLPDFIEKAVADNLCDATTGQQLLLAISPRLQRGFVEPSLGRLEGVI
jgi:hypothetical protein